MSSGRSSPIFLPIRFSGAEGSSRNSRMSTGRMEAGVGFLGCRTIEEKSHELPWRFDSGRRHGSREGRCQERRQVIADRAGLLDRGRVGAPARQARQLAQPRGRNSKKRRDGAPRDNRQRGVHVEIGFDKATLSSTDLPRKALCRQSSRNPGIRAVCRAWSRFSLGLVTRHHAGKKRDVIEEFDFDAVIKISIGK